MICLHHQFCLFYLCKLNYTQNKYKNYFMSSKLLSRPKTSANLKFETKSSPSDFFVMTLHHYTTSIFFATLLLFCWSTTESNNIRNCPNPQKYFINILEEWILISYKSFFTGYFIKASGFKDICLACPQGGSHRSPQRCIFNDFSWAYHSG